MLIPSSLPNSISMTYKVLIMTVLKSICILHSSEQIKSLDEQGASWETQMEEGSPLQRVEKGSSHLGGL